MFQRLAAFSLLLFGPITLRCPAESPPQDAFDPKTVLLQYRFETGDVVRYAVTHEANIRTTIDTTTEAVKTQSESTKAWKVLDVLRNGEIEFAHVVEKVRMRNELPNRAPSVYDSEKDTTPPPGFQQAAAAVGVTLTVVRMTPAGEIVSREDKHPQPGNADDAPIVIPLPNEPVAIGHEWNERHTVPVVLSETDRRRIETRRHFKLLHVKNDIATIEMTYQVLSPIDARIESQLVQRLAHGKIRFDIERGRIASQQLDVDKRIVGFAGPTSTMHFRSRFTEKLLEPRTDVAKKPDRERPAK